MFNPHMTLGRAYAQRGSDSRIPEAGGVMVLTLEATEGVYPRHIFHGTVRMKIGP